MRASVRLRSAEHGADRKPPRPAGLSPEGIGFTGRQDIALTAMLVLLCVLFFVATPLAGLGFGVSRLLISFLVLAFALLVILIARGRTASLVACFGAGCVAVGTGLLIAAPSSPPTVTVQSMNIIGIVICGYVIGRALFAPGPITLHRVIGAVVLYLTVGIAFAIAFRLVCDLIPEALHGTATGEGEIQLFSSILYFSLVTLTSTGYGDILPIHPIARSLANLESILGQIYPVTLVASLMAQHLEWRSSMMYSLDRDKE